MHTYTHAYIRTFLHAYVRLYKHNYILTYMKQYIHIPDIGAEFLWNLGLKGLIHKILHKNILRCLFKCHITYQVK